MGPQYDEIPYGDVAPVQFTQQQPGTSGKGQLPDVPAEYSQVPQVPARQGERWKSQWGKKKERKRKIHGPSILQLVQHTTIFIPPQ